MADLDPSDSFTARHIGPRGDDVQKMLAVLEAKSVDALIDETVPKSIRMTRALDVKRGLAEHELLARAASLASENQVFRSYLGMGYSDCITPPVIQRNILENPGWYTAYTPYQAEIAQGRLEALLNYQTMIADLTGMEIANASLLDEGTAAAEAMAMVMRMKGESAPRRFFVADQCHPQTIDVVKTRAEPLGIEIVVGDASAIDWSKPVAGVLLQVPSSDGLVTDAKPVIDAAHAHEALAVVAADILSLVLLTPPGEQGADVVIGSSQRFGVPMGYGGPHAAFLATKQSYARSMPGRIIGVSEDANGNRALRMALQTREQHIRREKATSNVCTAQVLLAVMASMYAVYHGPDGLRRIARRVHALTTRLYEGLAAVGYTPRHARFFDTLRIDTDEREANSLLASAAKKRINLRLTDASIGIALDETTTPNDVDDIVGLFTAASRKGNGTAKTAPLGLGHLARTSSFLTHPIFNTKKSETEMLRYMRHLEAKDLSLTHSMIPLGSCTMKLNATAEMIPVTMPGFAKLHPFAPPAQAQGYATLFKELEKSLAEITGFAGISLQPNAGSQGEYAGMLVIRAYHQSRGQSHRNICLIPQSAHGTNPATAVMAGLDVVVVRCDEHGNIDVADLRERATQHKDRVAALMVTYPSTHGVFEEEIKEICKIVHDVGGQVYMDGANMNAQVGLCRPGDIGADVCHLNLHKTFCIPHGGGGPGMGPIGVAQHLVPFLPSHPVVDPHGRGASETTGSVGAVSAAPWGSASILLISWAYIEMMGGDGLTTATKMAIANANYIAKRLHAHYPVLYQGKRGRVAHECILDLRPLKVTSGIEAEDVAKRLMDYGFHAPTMSFPVAGTLMIEPTESEPLAELDRFCDAMIAIRGEIADVESGAQPREGNVLKHAPHTAEVLVQTEWTRPYARAKAAFPLPWVRATKFWPSVGRLNNVLGDRKLICSCPPIEDYAADGAS